MSCCGPSNRPAVNAGTLSRSNGYRDEGLGRPLLFAVGLHVLIALFLWLSSWLSWDHDVSSTGGASIEATTQASAAEDRAVERALSIDPVPLPQPIQEIAEEETVPPPQPIEEPRPQDSPAPQQQVAQERIPVPDTQDQDEASRLAVSQEKALREQEEKRRQEQIDLTEQKRVEEAQKQQRLAKQQEADKQARLAEIRRQRAQLDQQQKLAEQKLRQIADARARAASQQASPAAGSAAMPRGNSGQSQNEWLGAVVAAIESQWVRPESVTPGVICPIRIMLLPGGVVRSADVQPNCPYDAAARESVARAVLKASPLPYRGYEEVAARDFIVRFQASR